MADRPTPFELVFGDLAPERFSAIREALAATGAAATDRDAFLLTREGATLVRDLRPDGEALGEAIDQLIGLVHHAFVMWDAGQRTFRLSPERTRLVLAQEVPADSPATPSYIQFPAHLIWAQVVEAGPHEPLDGLFHHQVGDRLAVLGVFGLHPERQGLSVVETVGVPTRALARTDGSGLFTPVLPGGESAGLYSLTGGEELIELGRRSATVVAGASGAEGAVTEIP